MANISGNAYALTVLSPIKNGCIGEISYADEVQDRLQGLGDCEDSPLAKVPQTYLARFSSWMMSFRSRHRGVIRSAIF